MAIVCKKCSKEIPYPNAHLKNCENKISDNQKSEEAVDPIPAKLVNEKTQPEEGQEGPKEILDYLRQYQIRKDTEKGSPKSDPVRGSKAERQKKYYLTQAKVRMFIPLKINENPTVPFTVNENGYRLDFPKNTYIEVPEQISDLILDSAKQTDLAKAQMLASRKNWD